MEVVFTPAGLLEVLAAIEQLKDCDISVEENSSGTVTLQIDDFTYTLQGDATNTVEIPQEALNTIEEINDDAYANIEEEPPLEYIETGHISDYARLVSLGGFVKMLVDTIK